MQERIKNTNPGGLFNKDEASPKKENVMSGKKVEQKQTIPTKKAEPAAATAAATEPVTTPQKEKPKQELTPAPHVPKITDIRRMSTPQLIRSAKEKFTIAMVGENPKAEEKIRAEKEFAKEASFALQAFSNNSYLETCAKNDRVAVINAIINVAQTGLTLNPVLKLGYLIPMDKKVQFWASYMGKREIVMRTGLVRDAYARLVYAGEFFEIKYGTGGYLKHTPDPWGKKKLEDVKGGYWYCILKDGTEKFGTMSDEEIEAIARRSPSANASHSPWKTDREQMALKTVFNRGFKEMPKSGISDNQLRALEASDRVEDKMFKEWVKEKVVDQESFDSDTEDDGMIQDAEVV